MIKRRKTLNNFFYRLLIGCLLFSVSLMSMPSWGQSHQSGRDFLGEKSNQVVIEEDNPGLALLIVAIVGIVTQIATTAWAARREREKPRPDPEKISQYINELDQLKSKLKTNLTEFASKLEGKINNNKAELEEEIDFLKKVNYRQNEDIANLEDKIEHQIAKIGELLPDLKETLDKTKRLITEMEDIIKRFKVVEKNLRQETESLKEADRRQVETIASLQEFLQNLTTMIDQEIKDLEKAIREELKKEVASLKAVNVQQAERTATLETEIHQTNQKIVSISRNLIDRIKSDEETTSKEIETLRTINAWQTKAIKRDRTIIFFLTLGIIYAISSSK